MSWRAGSSANSAAVIPAPTSASARSPTTLLDGVTLDQPAQNVVGTGVGVLDVLEPVAESQRDRLGAQVAQLPTGDLVVVNPAGGRG